ncbi:MULTISPECIES: response regulator [Cyanophyceae]|uniref:response regulator n=1 Tax=Cyanophyceae TaxID=3028117 RepID=UPI0016892AB9|nr:MULTISPECIES: response regulator [Cyanophyceae]MBD1914815.1 response regulator [Phormidium sp. FACHB-77]MBD2030918.1 response regulator [Phormidium sp. FACHB-322]MBD2052516.1 response regulator [Leptolyngbya sp. FACHB-60]
MKILLVDDDEVLIERLTNDLADQHYVVDTTTDGLMGWEYARSALYDLIVLDIDLPGLDGLSLCRRLRQTGYGGAILLLTARGSSTDKVEGLNAGADDYLVKPYTLSELTARLRALLRRPTAVSSPTLHWGQLQCDPNANLVTVADQTVVLSPKEYGLLELLLRHPDRIFSNTVLLERLWSTDDFPGEETIRTHIKRLRRKLKQAGADDMIENVYGMGYRLRPAPPDAEPELSLPDPPSEQAKAAAARAAAIAAFDQFRPILGDRMAALRRAAAALNQPPLTEEVRSQAQGAAHKLAGSLGLFGLTAGSHLARRLEDWLTQADATQGADFIALVDQLDAQLAAGPGESFKPSSGSGIVPLTVPSRPTDTRHRVLAVDDDPLILAQLQRLLPPWGLDVVTISDPRQTWAALEASPPDLLLLDLDMPHLRGVDLCRQLRQQERWQTLPILFLTACREPTAVYELYQAGADDYLPKPILEPELVNRLFQRLERGRLLQTLAGTDPLTGLANRRKGTIELDLLLHLAHRYPQPLSLVLLHLSPDPALTPGPARDLMVALAAVLPTLTRRGDAIARWGDQEILIGALAPTWPSPHEALGAPLAQFWADRLRSNPDNLGLPLGIQLGAATFPTDGNTLDRLYQQATHRLVPLV